ncbi:hypothetical protein [Noviherbaspirillum sp. Root189]|uniref:hypothetical protein n=1 Tax=Noviherbaspirillum sp. Root189 TaxID=1736487 RepID=UPI00070BE192|nr:hypothetical protein [Noviherbaspirillum sp. Root189]KRB84894.1 hypothetical protein ASE07_21865 [Noviherbaspirillum sp. Root189]
MEYLNDIKGPLNLMLYPARWKGLRRNETDRVLTSLIHPWIHKYPSHWYLERIVGLLRSKTDLSTFIFEREPSETDEEIRGFLSDLAVEIEKEYPVARSGRYATFSGTWICTTTPSESVQISKGERLPQIGNTEVVWMFKTVCPETAEDIIHEEFKTYYLPRTIKGRPKYMGSEEHAEYSLKRLSEKISPQLLPSVLNLLKEMERDREHVLTKKIEIETGCNWTKADREWVWYSSLLSKIREGWQHQ